ncbi:hypothetical protein QE450_004669 [Paenibacillus sp. SORGH_AS306]|uniref:DUF5071 domain-containing protein n=1 Tax=unclassified Paenibacillus TaxID=185978 RepID=UPI002784C988|nr:MULTISPECIES: DUF5071 domain-containing protein [unclassified Paenibacillus]MDQ1237171.1 hypothetical protein [Paenibacillus sp. SORGH_AS_0306]MDR6109530.1 hypothetical protein [Paenibacillus sp. SORGH_AS_0338]
MTESNHLIPESKFDFGAIQRLQQLDPQALIPILPELLVWLQDINWPVAIPMSKILLTVPDEIVPHVRDVLHTDDTEWIEWCLQYIVGFLPVALIRKLEPEIRRIADSPTQWEYATESHITAQEILDTLDHDPENP